MVTERLVKVKEAEELKADVQEELTEQEHYLQVEVKDKSQR